MPFCVIKETKNYNKKKRKKRKRQDLRLTSESFLSHKFSVISTKRVSLQGRKKWAKNILQTGMKAHMTRPGTPSPLEIVTGEKTSK